MAKPVKDNVGSVKVVNKSYISEVMSPLHKYFASVNSLLMSFANCSGVLLGVLGYGRDKRASLLDSSFSVFSSFPPAPKKFTTLVNPETRFFTRDEVSENLEYDPLVLLCSSLSSSSTTLPTRFPALHDDRFDFR